MPIAGVGPGFSTASADGVVVVEIGSTHNPAQTFLVDGPHELHVIVDQAERGAVQSERAGMHETRRVGGPGRRSAPAIRPVVQARAEIRVERHSRAVEHRLMRAPPALVHRVVHGAGRRAHRGRCAIEREPGQNRQCKGRKPLPVGRTDAPGPDGCSYRIRFRRELPGRQLKKQAPRVDRLEPRFQAQDPEWRQCVQERLDGRLRLRGAGQNVISQGQQSLSLPNARLEGSRQLPCDPRSQEIVKIRQVRMDIPTGSGRGRIMHRPPERRDGYPWPPNGSGWLQPRGGTNRLKRGSAGDGE